MILDLLGQTRECFFNVSARLCTHFEEEHIVLLSQLLRLIFLDLTVVIEVRLGANKYLADCLASVALDLFDPATDILEGLLVIDAIGQDDATGSLVIGLSDVPESFLSCSIPDLQSGFGTINRNGLNLEINSDGSDVAILEDSITKFGE